MLALENLDNPERRCGVNEMAGPPDYDEITRCLGMPGARDAAAEAHGTLCGLMCTAADDLPAAWIANTLADVMDDPQTAPVNARQALHDLYEASRTALAGSDMGFVLLLPGDEHELAARTDALASWCQGFLYGLAVRGLREFENLEGEIREFLEDLVQISRAGLDNDQTAEGDEAAYVELVEYVRVGVQLLYELMNPRRPVSQTEAIH